jgi:probable HAF family extracellular repeat protein
MLLAAILPGCQSGTGTASKTTKAPVIANFSASPSSVVSGKSSTLSWSVSDATSLSINQGVGTVTGSSASVTPSATTTYTLTATNSAGSTQATATVNVTAAPTPSFTTTAPSSATVGKVYTYTPEATESGATVTISATSMPSGATFSSGTLTWTPTADEAGIVQSFTLEASDGNGGTATQTWSVTPVAASSYAYTIIDLGVGGADGISDSNVVVGVNSNGPAYWDISHTVHQLYSGSGVARAISSDGTIVGEINPDAVAWVNGTEITLPDADTATLAIAINSSDHILGGGSYAYYWSAPTATATAIALQGSSSGTTFVAWGIDDADLIAGSETATAGQPYPVYWSTPSAKPTKLTLPFGDIGGAQAVSPGGAIAGMGKDSQSTNITHAVYWPSATGSGVDLGVLGVSGRNIPSAEAYGVNDSGEVVGSSSNSSEDSLHAFLYEGSLQDLNSISDASTKNLTLTYASAINSNGCIVGSATLTTDGTTHAYVAIPNTK